MRPILLFFVLWSFHGATGQEEALVQGARIVDYGVYEAVRVGTEDAPKTAEGTIQILHARLDPALRKLTTTIEARLGSRFGIRYEVQGTPHLGIIPVRVKITHPQIKNPDTGKTTTIDEWDAETSIGLPRYVGWGFDHQYEAAPGDWLIQVFHGSSLLVEKKFQVLAAAP